MIFKKMHRRITLKDYQDGINRLKHLIVKYNTYMADEREADAGRTMMEIIDIVYELSPNE